MTHIVDWYVLSLRCKEVGKDLQGLQMYPSVCKGDEKDKSDNCVAIMYLLTSTLLTPSQTWIRL